MLLETVRESNKSNHDGMEELIGSNRLSEFSIADYRLLMITNYIFHSSLENQLSATFSNKQKELLDFGKRKKSESLNSDLQKMKVDTGKIDFPSLNIDNFITGLGWLYVAEGSMLGGKYIHKILAENKTISAKSDFTFFKVYGSDTGVLWKKFKDLVEAECVSENQQENFKLGVGQAYNYFQKSFRQAESTINQLIQTQ